MLLPSSPGQPHETPYDVDRDHGAGADGVLAGRGVQVQSHEDHRRPTLGRLRVNQLSDRHLDAWMSEDDHCRDFLMYDQCAVLVLPDQYDDGFTRHQLRLKARQLPGEALGAYCRDLHVLWKQQWKGQCPVGEEDDEAT